LGDTVRNARSKLKLSEKDCGLGGGKKIKRKIVRKRARLTTKRQNQKGSKEKVN